jgi:4-hydroxybenzoate polyprenyltransferase
MSNRFKDTLRFEHIVAIILLLFGIMSSAVSLEMTITFLVGAIIMTHLGYVCNQNKYIIEHLEMLNEKNQELK